MPKPTPTIVGTKHLALGIFGLGPEPRPFWPNLGYFTMGALSMYVVLQLAELIHHGL